MKVLKFGGTSVGTAQRIKNVAQLVQGEGKCILVLSAMSGTTNALVRIDDKLKLNKKDEALILAKDLEIQYKQVVQDLLTDTLIVKKAEKLVDFIFQELFSSIEGLYTPQVEKAILAKGELLSTNLFQLYAEEEALNSAFIPALEFMRTDKDGEPDQYYIRQNLNRELQSQPDAKIFVTQGFICRNMQGEIDNLKRGGSDYSASLIGAACDAEEIQIWTDIDGIHNNDPRFVKDTKALSALSFDEAAELAYFGAKILHPSSVAPAKAANINVRLKNTLDPNAEGSLISKNKTGNGIKAIAAKDGITAININSSKMLMAHGFLSKVFEIFKNYETSVDMITTSEVAVSLTIDNSSNLKHILSELEVFAKVEVDANQSIVCVVGDFIAESKGYASKIFNSLRTVPIRMISFGGSRHNISLVVNEENKIEALQALNEEVFS